MEQQKEASPEVAQPTPEEQHTARQMAELEAVAAQRARDLLDRQNAMAERAKEEQQVSIIGLAAQGREALLEGMRKHAERAKPPPYVPPPMTERMMTRTQQEMEAGRRVSERAAAQEASRKQPPKDLKEGFTTPVYRPGNLVPDPTLPATVGPGGLSAAGTREYGPDAP